MRVLNLTATSVPRETPMYGPGFIEGGVGGGDNEGEPAVDGGGVEGGDNEDDLGGKNLVERDEEV